MIRLAAFFALVSCGLSAQQECYALKKRGRMADAQACFRKLAASSDPWKSGEGYWGLGRLNDANLSFRKAYALMPANPDLLTRWALLLLEGSNPADAARTVGEALEAKPDHPPALLASARIAAESFNRSAVTFAERAYAADPSLLPAKELLAVLSLEEGDRTGAEKHAKEAIAKSGEALDAMTVMATMDLLDGRKESPWLDKIRAVNPQCDECEARMARLFVLNRRYIEGIEHYENAARINPYFWAAKSELGINLMRVGRDQEARKLLVECYENGYRNTATTNSLRLLDSYKNFEVYSNPRFILRLHKSEARLMRPYVEAEMTRNLDDFEKKYGLKLPGPVTVEMYPDHEDFAVRTMGMPGLGALGVTFVLSVAMDSPAARKLGTFHWASTLRHELSHVFSLAATSHRIPRWFTEGIAVHEETSRDPEWGDRLTPDIVQAMKEKKLLPIASLDRGFIRPSYPGQVVVSYFQAGSVCDFIHEKHGWPKLAGMMKAFRETTTTADVVKRELQLEPEEFDRQFLAWLDAKYGRTVASFDEWTKGMKALAGAAKAGKWEEAAAASRKLIEIYPDYIEEQSPYLTLAEAARKRGDVKQAIGALESYAGRGGKSPEHLKLLAKLQLDAGNKDAAIAAYRRLLFITPVGDEELHRKLGQLLEEKQDWEAAAVEYNAIAVSKPVDPAAAFYDLARVLYAGGKIDEARDQVMSALEAAPGYRAAQKLLLELEAAAGKKDE